MGQRIQINRSRSFTNAADNPSSPIVRLNNKWLDELGGRHSWIRIHHGSRKILRRALGAGNEEKLTQDAMELDYDSRRELNMVGREGDSDGFYLCDAKVSKASILDKMHAHWKHPSLEYRISYRLALLGAVLGTLGLVTGILGNIS